MAMHSFRHTFCSVAEKTHKQTHWVSSTFILILGSLESVTDVLEKYRLRSKDGTAEEVGINDKRVFIQLNGLLSG